MFRAFNLGRELILPLFFVIINYCDRKLEFFSRDALYSAYYTLFLLSFLGMYSVFSVFYFVLSSFDDFLVLIFNQDELRNLAQYPIDHQSNKDSTFEVTVNQSLKIYKKNIKISTICFLKLFIILSNFLHRKMHGSQPLDSATASIPTLLGKLSSMFTPRKLSPSATSTSTQLSVWGYIVVGGVLTLSAIIVSHPKIFFTLAKPFAGRWSNAYREVIVNKKGQGSGKPIEIILTNDIEFNIRDQLYLATLYRNVNSKDKDKFIMLKQLAMRNSNNEGKRRKMSDQYEEGTKKKNLKDQMNIHSSQDIENLDTDCVHVIDLLRLRDCSEIMAADLAIEKTKSRISEGEREQSTNLSYFGTGSGLYHQEMSKPKISVFPQLKFESELHILWAQNIKMQIEARSTTIRDKFMVIKAPSMILKILECHLLGLKFEQSYKLGSVNENRLHILRWNQSLSSYEQFALKLSQSE